MAGGSGVVVLAVVALMSLLGSRTPAPAAVATPTIATPSPTIDPTAVLIESFRSRATGPKAAFHVDVTGRVSTPDGTFAQAFDVDVTGTDFKGRIQETAVGPAIEFVYKDGVAYTREAGKSWRVATDFDPAQGWNPLFTGSREPPAIRFVHYEQKNGQNLGILDIGGLTIVGPAIALVTSVGPPETASLQIEVTENGTPVRARFESVAPAAGSSAAGQRVRSSFLYEFSNVGRAVKIVAPRAS